jgi:hypothetical protein
MLSLSRQTVDELLRHLERPSIIRCQRGGVRIQLRGRSPRRARARFSFVTEASASRHKNNHKLFERRTSGARLRGFVHQHAQNRARARMFSPALWPRDHDVGINRSIAGM